MSDYGVFSVNTTKLCRWCGERVDIECEAHNLDEVPTELVKAMHVAGWRNGICPECAENPRVIRAVEMEDRADHEIKFSKETDLMDERHG